MSMLLELFPYSVYSLGLRPETVEALLTPETERVSVRVEVDATEQGHGHGQLKLKLKLCGMDVFVLPTRLLSRMHHRVETLIAHAMELEGPRASQLRPENRAYFHSIVLFNMALLEEGIRVEHLSTLNDAIVSSDPLLNVPPIMSSGLLIFPPPLVFEHFDVIINSDLVDASEEEFLGMTFSIDASGDASSCRSALHGLINAAELFERWQDNLSDNTFCLVAGQFMDPVSTVTYLEVNSHEALLRASLGQSGRTLVLSDSCEEFRTSSLALAGRQSFISSRNTLECISGDTIPVISIERHWSMSLPKFIRLNGCYDEAGAFRLGRSTQCRGHSGELSVLEVLYEALRSTATSHLPCLLTVTPALIHPDERERFSFVMKILGMVEVKSTLSSVAIGPQCSSDEISPISKLLPPALVENFLSPVLADESGIDTVLDTTPLPEPYYMFPSGGVGVSLLRDDHRIATSIENCLPRHIFQLLYGRLKHRSTVGLGANSHFVPFDGSPGRTVVEKVILQYLAPLVVGNQVRDRSCSFIVSLFVYPIITPRNSLNILSTLIYSTILKLG
jgi:hypothetical protein